MKENASKDGAEKGFCIELSRMESLLRRAKARLTRGTDHSKEDLSDYRADALDFAFVEGLQLMGLHLQDRKRQLLRRIEVALQKIQSGTFGRCETCEGGIGPSRLKACPLVRLCIRCQENDEREAHHRGTGQLLGIDDLRNDSHSNQGEDHE